MHKEFEISTRSNRMLRCLPPPRALTMRYPDLVLVYDLPDPLARSSESGTGSLICCTHRLQHQPTAHHPLFGARQALGPVKEVALHFPPCLPAASCFGDSQIRRTIMTGVGKMPSLFKRWCWRRAEPGPIWVEDHLSHYRLLMPLSYDHLLPDDPRTWLSRLCWSTGNTLVA
jgi:hypothetical protein